MAAFEYVALDQKGKQKKGVLEADSARQVRQQLRDKQWMPLSVDVTEEKNKTSFFGNLFKRAIGVYDLSMLTRQLATLIGAGLPIEEALKAAADQNEKKHLKTMMLDVRSKVLEGHSFAASLNEFDYAFPKLYRATVAAGEHAGHLDTVLNRLADYTERSYEAQREIKGAATYPLILLVVAIAIVCGLLVTVVPEIVDVFIKNGQELPGLTAFMLGLSDFLMDKGGYLFIVILASVSVFLWRMKQPSFKQKVHRTLLYVPFVGRMIKGFSTSRFASTLAILNSSGVPLVDAMRIATQVVTNVVIRERLETAAQQVSEGGALQPALAQTGVFPPMMLHMIASGEASGELDQMLERTATNQENDLQATIKTIVGMFQPMMLLFMAGMVMLIVLAIMLPIVNMSKMLG